MDDLDGPDCGCASRCSRRSDSSACRILQGWRTLKRFRRHLGKELDELADAGERTAEAAARATDTTELDQSLGRLRVTLARFAVLREALDEATGAVGRFAAVYPRK